MPAMPASTPQERLQQISNTLTLQEKRDIRRKQKMASKENYAKKHKVAVIGSGNWGSAIAKIVGENAKEHGELFDPEVKMWVFEEDYQLKEDHPSYNKSEHSKPQPLTKLINTLHENPKYLPGIRLPDNIVACPSLPDTVKDASILIFNVPHQFTSSICKQIDSHILPYARGISCIKGVDVSKTEINLFSSYISEKLNIYCGALSGANIADEVAREKFSETTIGYAPPEEGLTPVPAEYHPVDHALWKTLFHRPYFHVRCIDDVAGVSLGGALKNIIALGTGFVDGLGWGDNAKAAIMRVGLLEMRKFGKKYFSNCRTATFTEESCGVADLITSCNGGRNARCAKLAVQRKCSVEEVEEKELNGQKLQGTLTAREVNSFLKEKGDEAEFPLFTAIYQILKGEYRVEDLPDLIET